MGQEREKKILVPNSVLTRFGKENPKNIAKQSQKLKNQSPALFLAKTG